MMNTVHKKPRNPTQQAFYCQVLHLFAELQFADPCFSKPHRKKFIDVDAFFINMSELSLFLKR